MIYWIWLTQIPFIGPVTTRYLIKELGDAEKIYQADYETLSEMSGLSARQRESTSGIIHWKKRRGSWMIVKTKISLSYAGMMSVIPCVPENLLMHIKKMDQTVGIVGARRCSQKAKQETVFLASEYAKTRIAVVSGMAKGIDSYAHTACLNAGGYTIAILGNGLDICYPSEHHKLMKCIEEKGLLLSEYPPGTPPSRYTFPRRNRLISSWSDKLIIIQAGKGSGALITAEYSRKYGRKVEMKAEI